MRLSLQRNWIVVLILFSAIGCDPSDDSSTTETSIDDPFEGLIDVGVGDVNCNEDSCCFTRCWGNGDTVCVSRNAQVIAASFKASSDDMPCESIVFPEWFYNYDCFVGAGGIVGPGHPSAAGDPLTFSNSYSAAENTYGLFIQCFCGRQTSSYASEYSAQMVLHSPNCETPVSLVGEDAESMLDTFASCDNPCSTCTPNCTGKVCGSDSCGGICGSCSDGQSCSATGQCTTDGSADTCSACLSTCQGLPSCCTGCGCLCEDECGGCF